MELPEVQVINPSKGSAPTTESELQETPAVMEPTEIAPERNGGIDNVAFGGEDIIATEIPPLTFVDFMPLCLGTVLDGQVPEFDDFKSVMDQANQWLESTSLYSVRKCETVDKKLSSDFHLDNDAVFTHFSSNGNNTYLRGLRLWVTPKTDTSPPNGKISYLTVLPDHKEANVYAKIIEVLANSTFRMTTNKFLSEFDTLPVTIDKLNRHLLSKPVPGKILNFEVFSQKILETLKTGVPNTEETCWSECGRNNRMYIYAIRLFFFVGEPKYEAIGIQDTKPDITQNSDGFSVRVKFAPFNTVVEKAGRWLKTQEDVNVVNMQSPYIKCEKITNGAMSVDSDQAGYVELAIADSQYVKILRIFYVKQKKSSLVPTTVLSSRLFVPVRKYDTGREFESFSKTMQRTITWLNATNVPLLYMESVKYQVHPDSWGTGVHQNKVDMSCTHLTGRYFLNCIRLYFPVTFEEPQPEVLKITVEDETGWGCVVQ